MKNLTKSDLLIWIVIMLPFIYLAYIWGALPDKVPVHWNIHGEVDRYGGKAGLLMITFLPFFMYMLFRVFPKIDPKDKLKNMGKKYTGLLSVTIVFMSALSLIIIYTAKSGSFPGNMIIVLMGALFTLLGNYFKTIRANYFVGIRTPWTLESETVWKDTHQLGGKLWFVGGFLIMLSGIFASRETGFVIFGVILMVLIIVPVVYSYLRFRKLKEN